MLLFLAGIVEQLDLALEHLGKRTVHDARFSLMMTDNALELVLHQIVEDKRREAGSWQYREKPYPYETQLRKAYLGSFSDKVAFARIEAGLDDKTARTFNILHDYRNDLYHAGLAHESILQTLAQFYFNTACVHLSSYEPKWFGWASSQKMPDRAQKYFTGDRSFPGKPEDFAKACDTMAKSFDFDAGNVSEILADDLDRIIEDIDACIQVVSDGVYEGQQTSRDEAVLSTQAWDMAFSDEGREFAAKKGFEGNPLQIGDFLIQEFPFRFRNDPIAGWQAQSKKLRANADPHAALDHYQSFVMHTGPLRSALERSAAAAEAAIDAEIDRMRGK